MTRQARIDQIARRALSRGISPAAVASDEVELNFIRQHSGKVWDRIAELRSAGKESDKEREEGIEDEEFTPCPECGGSGEVDGKTCPECGGTGLVPVDDPEDEVDEDYEVELDGMRIDVDDPDD